MSGITVENRTSTKDESSSSFPPQEVITSKSCTHPFRTKALIADQLPTKTDKVVFCPLTETQRIAYENLMECEDIELIKRRSEPCECGSGLLRRSCCYATNAEGKRIEELIFPYCTFLCETNHRYMMYVQKLSNHIALMIPSTIHVGLTDPREWGWTREEGERSGDHWHCVTWAIPIFMYSWTDVELCRPRAMWEMEGLFYTFTIWFQVLEKLLQHWFREGSKVLIFSYSVRLLNMLDYLMVRKSYSYAKLDGSMDLEDRTPSEWCSNERY